MPILDDLRFETFSALAFGAQCIQCFLYWQPKNYKDENGNCNIFEYSPIDKYGGNTNTYDVVQDMNNEIKAVSNVFLGMHVCRVGFIGSHPPKGLTWFTDDLVEISFNCGNGKGFLISYFLNNFHKYVLIVNCDIANSQNIQVQFSENVKRIERDGSIIDFNHASYSNYTVEMGDHLLFQF